MKITLNCPQCGNDFLVRADHEHKRHYCSYKCKGLARRGQPIVDPTFLVTNCARCGTQFKARSPAAKFCSIACREAESAIELKCLNCDKPYMVKPSHKDRRRYCSIQCRDTVKKENALVHRDCGHCGKDFEATRYKDIKYCSKRCARLGMAETKRSEGGGGYLNQQGYRVISKESKQMLHHRYVVEEALGRSLYAWETIHHKNGERSDNRYPENLEVWIVRPHKGQRVADSIPWAIEFLTAYGYTVSKA